MNARFRAALLRASTLYSRSPELPRVNGSMIWNFNQITPSTGLNWVPCFDNFTCSRLQVPLDYADHSIGTTAIAFIKHSARNASSETRDILYNPGGPGDTGVGELISNIDDLRFILGDNYNIVSFDPRGVNNSGPSIDCFHGDQDDEDTFAATYIPVVDAESPQSVAQLWALAGAYGDWCSAAHQNDSARYVSTSAVAQDMLRYVDVAHKHPDEKLWYYGVSYGTALGGTFASLYPDRVGRMILDGVLDLEDWYAGMLKANILDDDKIVEQFFQYCYRAGPTKCAFHAGSPGKIEQRLRNLVEALRREPIGVTDHRKVTRPIIITYEVIRFAILNALYAPQEQWPGFAKQLLDLENRNGSSMARLAQLFHGPFEGSTVLCLDADGRYNLSTVEKFTEHVETMKSQSYWAGESWQHPLECRQMHATPPLSQRFDFRTSSTNETEFPILFVSNKLDPVTPLVGARKMHAHFSNSALLVQDAMGHASNSAPSNCTARYVQDYLKGSVPPAGTTCLPNNRPFDN